MITCPESRDRQPKLEPPLARQNLALSLSGPVALSFSRIVLIATCMSCLNLMPLTLGVGVAGAATRTSAYLPSQPIRLTASYFSNASLKAEGTWKHSKGVMANGMLFDENAYTCATWLYPLGTTIRVTNNANGKSVLAEVTDRIGKRFAQTRIDLSKAAFATISGQSGLKQGLLQVSVEVVK